jgi:hypothetical protein
MVGVGIGGKEPKKTVDFYKPTGKFRRMLGVPSIF